MRQQRLFKLGRYKISIRREKAAGHVGEVAYVDWKDGEHEFAAHVRSETGALGRFSTIDDALAAAKLRVDEINAGEPFHTVLAEFCDGPFYGGWHIYLRESTNGSRNGDGDWGWERRAGQEGCRVHKLVADLGYAPPAEERYGDKFEEWFAKTFPWGIRVFVGAYHKLIPLPLDEQHNSLRGGPVSAKAVTA